MVRLKQERDAGRDQLLSKKSDSDSDSEMFLQRLPSLRQLGTLGLIPPLVLLCTKEKKTSGKKRGTEINK